ncbi:hypothetical protein PGTUg99_029939 [Puccinia graminis f. sp. tritici]|uniref:Uncharacterized protein n=1 Tax=Puccinia graminis f. sp. tritici TaxID=56615 RepID=A0A5B0R7X9_PUCGR|nr:hypothetical protein PGTUg99_029939 [Puccinia graminis f. sp. tritici]
MHPGTQPLGVSSEATASTRQNSPTKTDGSTRRPPLSNETEHRRQPAILTACNRVGCDKRQLPVPLTDRGTSACMFAAVAYPDSHKWYAISLSLDFEQT